MNARRLAKDRQIKIKCAYSRSVIGVIAICIYDR